MFHINNEELTALYQDTKDKTILEKIIKENEGLIYFVMKRFRVEESERDDLYQEGCIGIMKAIEKFDSSMNNKFSTFVVWHIRASMRRYFDRQIGKHDEVDSLNEPVGTEQDTELVELIQDKDVDIEKLIKTKLESEELQQAIKDRCSELEQKVIYLYYYLNLTYKQIKEALQLSNAERVRTLIDKALRNIRRSPYGMRELKEIREREVDNRTDWIKAQRYDSIGTGNSHRQVYSPVEDMVLQRECIRQEYLY